ncbi:hypothetical protein Plhal304r1_c003g0013101 [Plasmopara halstedii]
MVSFVTISTSKSHYLNYSRMTGSLAKAPSLSSRFPSYKRISDSVLVDRHQHTFIANELFPFVYLF